jgi:hypothetical protein
MKPAPHEFVTVDMRGIKDALVARACIDKVSVSAIVRSAVVALMRFEQSGQVVEHAVSPDRVVKLSLRLTTTRVRQLDKAAQAAGFSRTAYVAGLVDGIPTMTAPVDLADHRAALTASNAALASLVRNVHHLNSLLVQASSRAAQEYRAMLDGLEADVRRHLWISGAVLADLRPGTADGVAYFRGGERR